MAKGRKTGGRKPGTPNRVTTGQRERWLATFRDLEVDFVRWVRETGDGYEVDELNGKGEVVKVKKGKNPGEAARIVATIAEFHHPKLGRQELVGGDGGPVEFTIRDLAKETDSAT